MKQPLLFLGLSCLTEALEGVWDSDPRPFSEWGQQPTLGEASLTRAGCLLAARTWACQDLCLDLQDGWEHSV